MMKKRCAVTAKQIGTDWILESDDGGQVVDRRAMRAGYHLFGLPIMRFPEKTAAEAWAKRNHYEVRS